jgi:hypothetical protein
MNITRSSTGKEIEEIALAIHELVNNLPLTMKTQDSKGIRVEDGKVIDYDYSGPILEKVLQTGEIFREAPETGPYTGIPVAVVPLKENDEVICAIGIVDVTKGLFSDMVEISRRPEPVKDSNHEGEFY